MTYYVFNIGSKTADQNWWSELQRLSILTCGFENQPGDDGEKILTRFQQGDRILAYAEDTGFVAVAEIDPTRPYELVDQAQLTPAFANGHRHWLGVRWVHLIPNLADAVAHREVRSAPVRHTCAATNDATGQEVQSLVAEQAAAAVSFSAVTKFWGAEDQYLEWVGAHPSGYVANIDKRHSVPQYPLAHTSSCKLIVQGKNFTTGSYYKVCSESLDALKDWSDRQFGKPLQFCNRCDPRPASGFWWVNHKQTSRVELAEGYIWSPREKKGGVRNQAYINLTLVRPGDIIISYAETLIKAIGVARDSYVDAPKPTEYGSAGETWSEMGWKVPVTWTYLSPPIRPKDHLPQIAELLPEKYSPLQRTSGDGNQSIYLAAISTELGELVLGLAGQSASKIRRLADSFSTGQKPGRELERLPVEQLRRVSARHVWQAVQDFLGGVEVPGFGPSTDYDLIVEGGSRLPPKAVFGLAATQALEFQVQPKHFTAGIGSPCFEILADAGYLILPKEEPAPIPDLQISYEDRVWSEGQPRLVTHLRKERGAGLAKAKKDHFRALHGRLFCERCTLDPVKEYGDAGEACIEVHHNKVQVAAMADEHQTRLEDLQCLCANCHRIVHRLLKAEQVAVASGEAVSA
ncbi:MULTISPECIES: hypothetical protein [unclassified Pseudomonas]|uniref:HNH endonuclease n=1 Tax=unclassified Pseudomonas TaxID=196821 RepID=UPI00244BB790|nr:MULTISPECIES: hypothetical protein [unclassified Pseudomonas]MDG9930342.1 hypothetical protein [Pseudomonas sp. GD04042]MDH0484545.1 hypothetical protein [Pseudomonas sp. GD04015]MDH0605997.1 hypothetical protein [Pseudomonas sp. GD03869]